MGYKRRHLADTAWVSGGGAAVAGRATCRVCGCRLRGSRQHDCPGRHGDSDSYLEQISEGMAELQLGLSACMTRLLERLALDAVATIQRCLSYYQTILQAMKDVSPVCMVASLQLRVLRNRLDCIWHLYKDGRRIGIVQLLLALVLLVARGKVFKRNRINSFVSVDLTMDKQVVDAGQWPAFVQLGVLRHLTPLLGCLLGQALVERPRLLLDCRRLVDDFCEEADHVGPTSGAKPAGIRIPSHVRALALDLDDTVFLHSHIGQLRELYWALAHCGAEGVDEHLLRDVILPAVPHRQFLLDLVASCHAMGCPVYVVSFGLRDWVQPVVDAIFQGRIPPSHVYSLPGHPPLFPVVLNKNLWLSDIQERAGARASEVVLVDDQTSNIARAMAAGFGALQVHPTQGLHLDYWRTHVCSAPAAERAAARVATRMVVRRRTHAYCPADGALVLDNAVLVVDEGSMAPSDGESEPVHEAAARSTAPVMRVSEATSPDGRDGAPAAGTGATGEQPAAGLGDDAGGVRSADCAGAGGKALDAVAQVLVAAECEAATPLVHALLEQVQVPAAAAAVVTVAAQ